MLLKYKLHNFKTDLVQIWRKYNILIYSPICILIYLFLYFRTNILNLNDNFISNVITISAIFMAFLFTAHTIILSLPTDKKFISLLKDNGYFKKMFILILLAEICLVLSLLIALFSTFKFIVSLLFLIGLMFTIHLSSILFKISFYILD